MIRYNFLLFLRSLQRQRMFSFINLLGLTTGIVSSLLIYLYVEGEFSHDKFHQNSGRIYRINQTFIWGDDNNQLFSSTGPGVGYAISSEIPEAEQVVRIHQPAGNSLISYKNEKNEVRAFDETKILLTDSNFFKVFTFPLLKGNPETALVNPNTVVLTESTAKRYFGDEDPIGKMLEVDGFIMDQPEKIFQVTGVINDVPGNSYLEFDFLMSMNSLPRVKKSNWSWVWTMFETFVLIDKHATPDAVQSKLAALPKKYAEKTLQIMGTTYDDYTKSGKEWKLYMQPLTDIHLRSGNLYNRLNDVGNIRIVYILVGIVVTIILLSCINFMNLSTARYTRRLKETSLRKVLGSNRMQLAGSFFIEAFLFCCIAIALGVGITEMILPQYNVITGNNYDLRVFSDPNVIMMMAALLIVMSTLSGSYPAIFMSAFKPVDAMKGKLRTGVEGRSLRNGLVIFQFAISIILIVCTMVVFDQLRFLSNKDVGFDRENLMVVNRVEWVKDKETFINSLSRLPGVRKASWCSSVPPELYDGDSFNAEGNQDKTISLNYVKADEDYAETLELEITVGRNFQRDFPSDANGVILNETAVKDLGWKLDESTIGKKIFYPGSELKFSVIGIVKDFNYWSVNGPIQPMAMFNIKSEMFSSNREFVVLKITGDNTESWQNTIAGIENEWKKFAGDAPFKYSFVDQTFAASFSNEQKFGEALSIFSGLAILIACLGLLGMIIFTVELRTKEIGIRKVIGASVMNIILLVTRDYVKLVVIAAVISIPVSLWLMNQWLEQFFHRIRISPSVFIVAGLSSLALALLITSYHAVRAAMTNPVDVLKDE